MRMKERMARRYLLKGLAGSMLGLWLTAPAHGASISTRVRIIEQKVRKHEQRIRSNTLALRAQRADLKKQKARLDQLESRVQRIEHRVFRRARHGVPPYPYTYP